MSNHTVGDSDLATQRVRLWLNMLKAVRHIEGGLREHLRKQYNMTLPRFDVLAALYAAPEGLRMSELSNKLVVSNGNVTGVVERLLNDGLVEKQNIASDRRAYLIKITNKGYDFMDEATQRHKIWVNRLFEGISAEDVSHGIALMLELRHKESPPETRGL